MSTTLSSDLRCPQCGAHLPAAADWCSLCYAALRPAPAPAEVEADVEAESTSTVTEPAAVVPGAVAASPRGKHARRDPESEPRESAPAGSTGSTGSTVSDDEKSRLADALLAELAAQSDNSLSQYSSLIDTPAKKAAFIVGGAVSAMAVLLALMALAGVLL